MRRFCLLVSTILGLVGTTGTLAAQESADVVRGRVTTAEGKPVPRATVTVTDSLGRSRKTSTDTEGRYTTVFRDGVGVYEVRVAGMGITAAPVMVRRNADEAVLIADVKLAGGASARGTAGLDTVKVTVKRQRAGRETGLTPGAGSAEESVFGAQSSMSPEEQGNLAALAGTVPGVMLTPDGFSILGLGADQNSITLNGMQLNADQLPRGALVGGGLATTTFDASRGGFSGGQLGLVFQGGFGYIRRRVSAMMELPQLQFVDRAARQLGQQYTNLDLSLTQSGPLLKEGMYYATALQVGRRSNDLQMLALDHRDALQRLGVAPDSVSQFLDHLHAIGIPVRPSNPPSSSNTTRISTLTQVDYAPPATNRTLRMTLLAGGNRAGGSMLSPNAVLARGGTSSSSTFALQGAYSTYFKDAFLSDFSIGLSLGRNRSTPYFALPGGQVRVSSMLPDGTAGQTTLLFGGSPTSTNSSSTWSLEVRNEIGWYSLDSKHRWKLSLQSQLSGMGSRRVSNGLGSFTYESLASLADGTPSSFTRMFDDNRVKAAGWQFAASLGDAWRPNRKLQVQYGLRLEGNRYLTVPQYNPHLDSLLGGRTDRVPNTAHVSPRVGFTWIYRQPNMTQESASAFMLGVPGMLRGGIGEFRNEMSPNLITSYLSTTGLPDSRRQLICVGADVPSPQWDQYAGDLSLIPDECVSGSTPTPYSVAAPAVQYLGPSYTAPRSWRANLAWSFPVGKWNFSVQEIASLNLNQSRSVDRNFANAVQFALPDELNRPVFVPLTSVVPQTGLLSSAESRRTVDYVRVMEMRSDLRSWSNQLMSTVMYGSGGVGPSLTYVLFHQRAQLGGWTSTAGNPMDVSWGRGAGSRHQFMTSIHRSGRRYYAVLTGSFRSGTPYTPLVGGDINGDGSVNDRAFIPNPATTTDPDLAAGMEALLQQAPKAARSCLERQMGSIAGYNSCVGPWTQSLNGRLSLYPGSRISQAWRSLSVTVNMTNILGGLDQLFHGTSGLKGWGAAAYPEARLLTPRGFDASARRFVYEVNPRFGETRPARSTVRAPFRMTISLSMDLAPPIDLQVLRSASKRTVFRTIDERKTLYRNSFVRSEGFESPILRLRDSLGLTAEQVIGIQMLNKDFLARSDSLWRPLIDRLAAAGEQVNASREIVEIRTTRVANTELMREYGPRMQAVLTPYQWQQLPAYLRQAWMPVKAP